MRSRVTVFIGVLIVLTSLSTPVRAEKTRPDKRADTAAPATAQTLQALRHGGFVLYMRHTASDTSRPDRAGHVDLNDCATQRPLSKEGRDQAARIGKAVRGLGIPIGEIRVSPYCRARDTAHLAFGGKYIVDPGLATTSNLTDTEKAPLLEDLRHWLAQPVPPGTNRLLVSHNAPLMDATGIYPRPEGVILVFRPDGNGGFKRIATILPDDWDRLAALPR